jgi:hypothetical protein
LEDYLTRVDEKIWKMYWRLKIIVDGSREFKCVPNQIVCTQFAMLFLCELDLKEMPK